MLTGLRKISPALYQELKNVTFGKQTVTGLQLCAMYLPKNEHGYYHVEEEVEFGKNKHKYYGST